MIDINSVNKGIQSPFRILQSILDFLGPMGILLVIIYVVGLKYFNKVEIKERTLWPYYLPKHHYDKWKSKYGYVKKDDSKKIQGPYSSWRKEQRE